MLDFYPEIQKLKPFDMPIRTKSELTNENNKIFARIESLHGCKFCSVRYLRVGSSATVCEN
jgi:hypothetical protein